MQYHVQGKKDVYVTLARFQYGGNIWRINGLMLFILDENMRYFYRRSGSVRQSPRLKNAVINKASAENSEEAKKAKNSVKKGKISPC